MQQLRFEPKTAKSLQFAGHERHRDPIFSVSARGHAAPPVPNRC
jgi:hypothetical protein